jgi:predicted RNA binding protein YcfA (HicA-like mRNA interferase family)
MKLQRDLSGTQLIKALKQLGYQATHQTGSHVRLTNQLPKQHHLTIPLHDSLRIGTLAAILADVAIHQEITRDELLARLFHK